MRTSTLVPERPRGGSVPDRRSARPAFDGLSDRTRNLLRLAEQAGQESGARVYLVGGAVRDLLLERPIADIDLVATGNVELLVESLGHGLASAPRRNRRFGTWCWRRPDGSRIDLARARRETYSLPGALPKVSRADLESDLARRDFSINAMALDVGPTDPGRLHDSCGGLEDLKRRRIRILHGLSFVDDPTRLFRAIRFAGRLGFSLDASTAQAFRGAIHDGVLQELSAARLRTELVLLLSEELPLRGIRLAETHGLWQALHPRLRVGREPRESLRVLLSWLDRREPPPSIARLPRWSLLLGAMIEPLSPAAGGEILDRLGIGGETRRMLEEVLTRAGSVRRRVAGLVRPTASRVDAVCGPAHPGTLAVASSRGSPRARRLVRRWLSEWSSVRADVTGGDLLAAEVPAGPRIARGLEAARRAKLDGRAPGRSEQLRVAVRRARRA